MAFIGILMLDTRFPRPPGDIGNPATFAALGIEARLRVVSGASPIRVVSQADPRLLAPFIAAACALQAEGATLISTSCGFLAAHQASLSAAVSIPVATSSLLQCAALSRPGILTFDAASLNERILAAAGVPSGTPVQGIAPGCEFHRRIMNNDSELDLAQAERDVVDAALRLVGAHPEIEQIVLECTNMPPYRDAIARATGRPVHDIVDMLARRFRLLA